MAFVPVDIGAIKLDAPPPAQLSLAGKSLNDLSPEEREQIRAGISTQVGTGLVGAADARSFGFGDEIAAGMGAWPALLTDELTLGQAYDKNLDRIRGGQQERREDNPGAYMAGQLAGAIGGGRQLAQSGLGRATTRSLGAGNLAARTGKAGLLGAGASGVAGFGAGSGVEDRLESSRDAGVVGLLGGAAIPVAGHVAGKLLTPKQKIPTADELRSAAGALYKTADQRGGVLKNTFTNKFLDEVDKFRPQTEAGKLLAGDDAVTKITENLGSLRNRPISLQEAQEIDEFLGDAIDGYTELGRVTKQGKKLLDIQTTLRNMIDEADQSLIDGGKEGFDALKKGRQVWGQQAKLRDIEKIIQRAESMDNPATGIKTGFRTLANNAQKLRGFTKEEKALIKQASETGIVSDLLRTGGSRLIPIIAGAGGGGVLGTAAAQMGSTASRGLATKNALYKASKVAKEVATRGAPKVAAKALALPNPAKTAPLIGAAGAGLSRQINEESPPTAPAPTAAPAFRPININEIQLDEPLAPQSSNFNDLAPRIAQAESGGNPNAQSTRSSASGLYQFTDPTWRSAVDKWGRKYGIKYADKSNPQAQEALLQELLKDNARILEAKGFEATPDNLYFAHFMGAPAASKALGLLGKRAIAARSFPKAAQSNPAIFFDQGKPRTVDEVYQLVTGKV